MMVDILGARTVMGMYMGAYNPITLHSAPSFCCTNRRTKPFAKALIVSSSSSSSFSRAKGRTAGGLLLQKHDRNSEVNRDDDNDNDNDNDNSIMKKKKKKKRVFFLDVNPICYDGSTPSLHSFTHWISLFFSQVSLTDPVIAVVDGEGAHEYRRQMLPSYKAHRRKFSPWVSSSRVSAKVPKSRSHQLISDTLTKCNVPVVKIPSHEADDVVATLVEQVLEKGYRVVIASPDKDFKQLICQDVQLVMPLPELKRWSFYTLEHYIAQYKCDPLSDLSLNIVFKREVQEKTSKKEKTEEHPESPPYGQYAQMHTNGELSSQGVLQFSLFLTFSAEPEFPAIVFKTEVQGNPQQKKLKNTLRAFHINGCIVGDEADGVPGIQHLVPGFGMKTALKLLKKHGSLENLLNAAAVRTVGKPYVQDALTKHASHFRRNYEVLSLRRDVDIRLQEEWLHERRMENDLETLSNFLHLLQ